MYLFMRGHNEPGGGFVAGLVFSVALLLQYIVSGTSWVEAHLPLYPRRWIGVGLLAALATGLGALAWGYPFLTSHTAHFSLPVVGEIHVASALFFDIGVFTLVVGSTMLHPHRHCPPVGAQPPLQQRTRGRRSPGRRHTGRRPMELILALAIGVLTGSGVWLLLRPRTFQVIMGLSLLSYAVNLFIFITDCP